MDVLEQAVSQTNYLLGDAFTAADVYLGSQIGFGLMFNTIDKRPAFQSYWTRITSRPAYKRARELDDALMPPQQAAG
jgi:glutathione S-transferase